jgi:nicotinamidase-related amidase
MTKFYVPVDLGKTALLLSDIQDQILRRFPKAVVDEYISHILTLLKTFRDEIDRRRSNPTFSTTVQYDGVPLIIHHVFPFGITSNAFVSPYNKLSKWVKNFEDKELFDKAHSDPNHPHYAIPEVLTQKNGWGGKDETILSKIQPGCFSSSDLLAYLRARGIHHVVLCGLTTAGSILGSARLGAHLDFHIIVPREG